MAKSTGSGAEIDPAFMAANNAYQALKGLEGEELSVAVAMLSQRLGIRLAPDTGGAGPRRNGTGDRRDIGEGTPDPKAFVSAKHTNKDIERVTVYAYYLVHYRDQQAFNGKDIEAFRASVRGPAIPAISVPIDNASKAGYLTSVGGGRKGITARGEALVEALPDRGAVDAALKAHPVRARRTRKKAAKRAKGGS